jgi:hypothetical protein
MAEPISEQDLKAIAQSEVRSAMGELTGDLANERAEALDYYYGQPIGRLYQPNEDRSSVVITTVRDTVEWMMPQLMRMFAQADNVVTFDQVGDEDEEAAEQETQAINHVFWRQNEGFLVLYTWFKDALLQKNGTVKFWVEETEDGETEEYDGLTDMALTDLLKGGEYEVTEHAESEVESMDGQMLHRLVLKRIGSEKKLCVANVPPEEFLISDDAKSLDVQSERPRMVGHHSEKSASELKAMGFSEEAVEDMMKGSDDDERYDAEWTSRYNYSDEQQILTGGTDYGHESQRKTRFYELYMDLDMDGDGSTELIKVYMAGDYIEHEEADHVPFACLTPYINPHKHHGQSEYDMVRELQEISTQVFRNVLDNMYQTNNTRVIANENVDLDSLLMTRPGAPIYTETRGPVTNDVAPFAPPVMWEHGLGILEYLDEIRKDRTGISDTTLGLNADTLANANTGVMLEAMEAARGKIELVARIFAETGIKWLFRGLHQLARKNYDQELRYELSGKYTAVNPQEWRKRTNLTINVGVASGSSQRELMRLQTIGEIQAQMVAGQGLGITILPSHLYQTAKDIAENLGAKDGDKYFLNPMMRNTPQVQQMLQIQMPQQGPDPTTQALMANAQIESKKADAAAQKAKMEYEVKVADLQLKREESEMRRNLEAMKTELAGLQAAAKNQTEMEKVRTQAQAKEVDQVIQTIESRLSAQMEKYRADMQSYTAFGVKALDMQQDEESLLHDAEMRVFESRQRAEMEQAQADKIRSDIAVSQQKAEQDAQAEAERAQADQAKLDEAAQQTKEMQALLNQSQTGIVTLMDKLDQMKTEMGAPKEIKRDASGKPISVGGKPVIYDNDGSIKGLG